MCPHWLAGRLPPYAPHTLTPSHPHSLTLTQFLGFLDTLCGPRASELKVKDMDKYAFHPRQLVAHISSVLLHVWRQDKQAGPPAPDSFTLSMAMHPDLSLPTLGKCVSVLQKQQLLDAAALADFSGFTQEVGRSRHMTRVGWAARIT